MALSMTLNHPAFQRATEGFADNGRVYLAYRDEQSDAARPPRRWLKHERGRRASRLRSRSARRVSFVNRRGLRVNDICPESVVVWRRRPDQADSGSTTSATTTSLQGEPLFNDGYTAPEIYQGAQGR